MPKMLRSIIATLLAAVMLCIAPVLGVQADDAAPEPAATTFMEQSDYSVALFQIKQPAAAGQEFIADFTRLAEISAYLQITNACDITLKITSGMATGEPQELYSEVFTVEPTKGGWVTFTPSEPVALSANQKYEFTLFVHRQCYTVRQKRVDRN